MPAPGTCWKTDSWDVDAWGANTWGNAAEPYGLPSGGDFRTVTQRLRPFLRRGG